MMFIRYFPYYSFSTKCYFSGVKNRLKDTDTVFLLVLQTALNFEAVILQALCENQVIIFSQNYIYFFSFFNNFEWLLVIKFLSKMKVRKGMN